MATTIIILATLALAVALASKLISEREDRSQPSLVPIPVKVRER